MESFNARLPEECLNRNIFASLAEVRHLIEEGLQEYNGKRPHSAPGSQRPAGFPFGPSTFIPDRSHSHIPGIGQRAGAWRTHLSDKVKVCRRGLLPKRAPCDTVRRSLVVNQKDTLFPGSPPAEHNSRDFLRWQGHAASDAAAAEPHQAVHRPL